MKLYIAFIDGKPGQWGAVFPDAPGCTAMGEDVEETIRNATAALREWMSDRVADGLEPPPGRGIADLLMDPDVDAESARHFVHVPLLLDAGRTVRANISLDAGLLDQIDEAAKLRGLTRSAFLASAAREKIAEQR